MTMDVNVLAGLAASDTKARSLPLIILGERAVAPRVSAAVAIDAQTVLLFFNMRMLEADASFVPYYTITPAGGSVARSILSIDFDVPSSSFVTLHLDGPISPGTLNYTVTVDTAVRGLRLVELDPAFDSASFSGCPPPVPFTPWNRDLSRRQARIAIEGLRAIGTMRMVSGALLVDGDFFVLPDGRNAPTRFEYDDDGIVTAGSVPLEFDASMTEEEIRDVTIEAINSVDVGLKISAFESPATPGIYVGLVHDDQGELGNQTIIEGVSDPGFVVDGMRDGADALDVGPQGLVAAPEGEHVFVLGYELPGLFHRFELGDFAQVEQTDDFDTTNIVRVLALVRSTEDMPAGLAWRLTLLIDGVEYTRRTLEPGRDRRLVDLAANVSKLTGDHSLAFRVELVSV